MEKKMSFIREINMEKSQELGCLIFPTIQVKGNETTVNDRDKLHRILRAVREFYFAEHDRKSANRYHYEEGPIDPEGAEKRIQAAKLRMDAAQQQLQKAQAETGLTVAYV